MIPLGKSIMYVEPVFLQADAGGLPELKRVIVAAGDQIAMAPTLEESLAAIFGTEAAITEPAEEPPTEVEDEVVAEPPVSEELEEPVAPEIAALIEQAQQHYDRAQQYLQAGDWTGYGSELDALEAVLKQLAELAAAE